jgi:hypothetical protein
MSEKPPKQIEPNVKELKLRLIKATEPIRRERRTLITTKDIPIQTSTILTNTSSEEIFVIFTEEMRRYKTVISGNAADKIYAKIEQLADGLADTLPGNDSGVKFVVESMNYIETHNPSLGEEVNWQMDAAWKRKSEREIKREDFYRKWIKNQRS